MNLREQINKTYDEYGANINEPPFADTILALPSGLEAVKKCPACINDTLTTCVHCHGTGEIVRDLTVGEVLEAFNGIVTIGKNSDYGLLHRDDGTVSITLPSGERVRMKKETKNDK